MENTEGWLDYLWRWVSWSPTPVSDEELTALMGRKIQDLTDPEQQQACERLLPEIRGLCERLLGRFEIPDLKFQGTMTEQETDQAYKALRHLVRELNDRERSALKNVLETQGFLPACSLVKEQLKEYEQQRYFLERRRTQEMLTIELDPHTRIRELGKQLFQQKYGKGFGEWPKKRESETILRQHFAEKTGVAVQDWTPEDELIFRMLHPRSAHRASRKAIARFCNYPPALQRIWQSLSQLGVPFELPDYRIGNEQQVYNALKDLAITHLNYSDTSYFRRLKDLDALYTDNGLLAAIELIDGQLRAVVLQVEACKDLLCHVEEGKTLSERLIPMLEEFRTRAIQEGSEEPFVIEVPLQRGSMNWQLMRIGGEDFPAGLLLIKSRSSTRGAFKMYHFSIDVNRLETRAYLKMLRRRGTTEKEMNLHSKLCAAGVPHIPRLYYYDKETIVMQNFQQSLLSYLEKLQGSSDVVVQQLGATLSETLRAMHKEGFLHRDLKTGNVMVDTTKEGEIHDIKVIDFGISMQFDPEKLKEGMQVTESVDCSPENMPPEYASDPPQVGTATDIYHLGLLLFHTRYKRAFFQTVPGGDKEALAFAGPDRGETYKKEKKISEVTAEATLIREYLTKANVTKIDPLDRWIYKMIHPDPTQRPSADEVYLFFHP